MAIESFGFDEVLAKLGAQKTEQAMNPRILRELTSIAEEACNMARNTYPSRDSGGYDDHSRNLRGSYGFKILYMGKEVGRGGFDGKGSGEGEAQAQVAVDKVASDGALWEIIIVAGMEYARYVEAKGYNVITFVQSYLTKEVNDIKEQIKKGEL